MENDKITYWEERTINIGNYEAVKCGLTYSSSIKVYNNSDKTVSISEMQTATVDTESEAFKSTVKTLQNRVRAVLNAREADLRLRAENFVDGYSPTTKALVFKVIDALKFKKKKQQIESDFEEIADLENSIDDSKVFNNG